MLAFLALWKFRGFVGAYSEIAEEAEREGWSFEPYLHHLAEVEVETRGPRRVERLQRKSGFPHDRTSGRHHLGVATLHLLDLVAVGAVTTLISGPIVPYKLKLEPDRVNGQRQLLLIEPSSDVDGRVSS